MIFRDRSYMVVKWSESTCRRQVPPAERPSCRGVDMATAWSWTSAYADRSEQVLRGQVREALVATPPCNNARGTPTVRRGESCLRWCCSSCLASSVELLCRCSQYLGVKYFRENTLQVLRVLAVFRVYVLQILRVPEVFPRFGTANTCRLAVFRGWGCSCAFFFFQDSVLQVLAICRPSLLLVLRVLAVPKCSQYAQYTRSMKYTSTSVHRFDS